MKMVERNCHYVELHIYIIHLKKKIDFTCSARIKKLSSRATIGFTLTLCLHFIPQQRPFCPSLYL